MYQREFFQKEIWEDQGLMLETLQDYKQILKGVEFLHANKVGHLDLKEENILCMPDGTLKLADFGISRFNAD